MFYLKIVISKMRVKMNFSIKTKNVKRFLRLRQTISERVKDCQKEKSNSRELADQPRDLTTKLTALGRRYELLKLIYDSYWKSVFENDIFSWCQGIFFVNFYFKNGCKNVFEDNNEISCSRFKNRVPRKIDFRAEWTHESSPTGSRIIFFRKILSAAIKLEFRFEMLGSNKKYRV